MSIKTSCFCGLYPFTRLILFLSTSVRLYQALEAAVQETKLDVYEDMWHVFQTASSPETEVSLQKIKVFFHQHLK